MSAWEVERAFNDAVSRLEWEVSRLRRRDGEWESTKPAGRARQDQQSRVERAFSFVFVSGVLEDLFRQLNLDLPIDFRRIEVRARNLRPYALSVMFPKAWDQINTERVVRLVKRRDLVEVIANFYSDPDPIDLTSLANLGVIDGRTIDTHNFEALWEGLCLSPEGKPFWQSSRHEQSVRTVHDKRNLIAHFETDPRDEAFRFTYRDLAGLVASVLESVQRLEEHVLLWLDRYELKP